MLTMSADERETFAGTIRDEIEDGSVSIYVSYEPGNATHYDLLLVAMDVPVRLESPPNRPRHMVSADRWLVADTQTGRCAEVDLSPGETVYPSQLREHMSYGEHDSVVVAELLNLVTNTDRVDQFRRDHWDVLG